MISQNHLKSFPCNIHNTEPIQRISLDLAAPTSLHCIECILSINDKNTKESIVSIKDFLDHAAKHYETYRDIGFLGQSASQELVDILSKEEDTIQKLTLHIENEKYHMNDTFDKTLQEITLVLHSKK